MRLEPILRQRIAIDRLQLTPDGLGGQSSEWVTILEARAAYTYERGTEAVDGGGLTGMATFKVRVRSTVATRAISVDDQMRDVHRNWQFNIREVDPVSHSDWVWLSVERGVAI